MGMVMNGSGARAALSRPVGAARRVGAFILAMTMLFMVGAAGVAPLLDDGDGASTAGRDPVGTTLADGMRSVFGSFNTVYAHAADECDVDDDNAKKVCELRKDNRKDGEQDKYNKDSDADGGDSRSKQDPAYNPEDYNDPIQMSNGADDAKDSHDDEENKQAVFLMLLNRTINPFYYLNSKVQDDPNNAYAWYGDCPSIDKASSYSNDNCDVPGITTEALQDIADGLFPQGLTGANQSSAKQAWGVGVPVDLLPTDDVPVNPDDRAYKYTALEIYGYNLHWTNYNGEWDHIKVMAGGRLQWSMSLSQTVFIGIKSLWDGAVNSVVSAGKKVQSSWNNKDWLGFAKNLIMFKWNAIFGIGKATLYSAISQILNGFEAGVFKKYTWYRPTFYADTGYGTYTLTDAEKGAVALAIAAKYRQQAEQYVLAMTGQSQQQWKDESAIPEPPKKVEKTDSGSTDSGQTTAAAAYIMGRSTVRQVDQTPSAGGGSVDEYENWDDYKKRVDLQKKADLIGLDVKTYDNTAGDSYTKYSAMQDEWATKQADYVNKKTQEALNGSFFTKMLDQLVQGTADQFANADVASAFTDQLAVRCQGEDGKPEGTASDDVATLMSPDLGSSRLKQDPGAAAFSKDGKYQCKSGGPRQPIVGGLFGSARSDAQQADPGKVDTRRAMWKGFDLIGILFKDPLQDIGAAALGLSQKITMVMNTLLNLSFAPLLDQLGLKDLSIELITAFRDSVYMNLVLLMISIGALIAVFKAVRGGAVTALKQMLMIVLVFMLGAMLMYHPDLMFKATDEFPSSLERTIAATILGTADQTELCTATGTAKNSSNVQDFVSIDGDDLGFNGDASVRTMECEVWNVFVFTPWAYGQFGASYNSLWAHEHSGESGNKATEANELRTSGDVDNQVGSATVDFGNGVTMHNWALYQLDHTVSGTTTTEDNSLAANGPDKNLYRVVDAMAGPNGGAGRDGRFLQEYSRGGDRFMVGVMSVVADTAGLFGIATMAMKKIEYTLMSCFLLVLSPFILLLGLLPNKLVNLKEYAAKLASLGIKRVAVVTVMSVALVMMIQIANGSADYMAVSLSIIAVSIIMAIYGTEIVNKMTAKIDEQSGAFANTDDLISNEIKRNPQLNLMVNSAHNIATGYAGAFIASSMLGREHYNRRFNSRRVLEGTDLTNRITEMRTTESGLRHRMDDIDDKIKTAYASRMGISVSSVTSDVMASKDYAELRKRMRKEMGYNALQERHSRASESLAELTVQETAFKGMTPLQKAKYLNQQRASFKRDKAAWQRRNEDTDPMLLASRINKRYTMGYSRNMLRLGRFNAFSSALRSVRQLKQTQISHSYAVIMANSGIMDNMTEENRDRLMAEMRANNVDLRAVAAEQEKQERAVQKRADRDHRVAAITGAGVTLKKVALAASAAGGAMDATAAATSAAAADAHHTAKLTDRAVRAAASDVKAAKHYGERQQKAFMKAVSGRAVPKDLRRAVVNDIEMRTLEKNIRADLDNAYATIYGDRYLQVKARDNSRRGRTENSAIVTAAAVKRDHALSELDAWIKSKGDNYTEEDKKEADNRRKRIEEDFKNDVKQAQELSTLTSDKTDWVRDAEGNRTVAEYRVTEEDLKDLEAMNSNQYSGNLIYGKSDKPDKDGKFVVQVYVRGTTAKQEVYRQIAQIDQDLQFGNITQTQAEYRKNSLKQALESISANKSTLKQIEEYGKYAGAMGRQEDSIRKEMAAAGYDENSMEFKKELAHRMEQFKAANTDMAEAADLKAKAKRGFWGDVKQKGLEEQRREVKNPHTNGSLGFDIAPKAEKDRVVVDPSIAAASGNPLAAGTHVSGQTVGLTVDSDKNVRTTMVDNPMAGTGRAGIHNIDGTIGTAFAAATMSVTPDPTERATVDDVTRMVTPPAPKPVLDFRSTKQKKRDEKRAAAKATRQTNFGAPGSDFERSTTPRGKDKYTSVFDKPVDDHAATAFGTPDDAFGRDAATGKLDNVMHRRATQPVSKPVIKPVPEWTRYGGDKVEEMTGKSVNDYSRGAVEWAVDTFGPKTQAEDESTNNQQPTQAGGQAPASSGAAAPAPNGTATPAPSGTANPKPSRPEAPAKPRTYEMVDGDAWGLRESSAGSGFAADATSGGEQMPKLMTPQAMHRNDGSGDELPDVLTPRNDTSARERKQIDRNVYDEWYRDNTPYVTMKPAIMPTMDSTDEESHRGDTLYQDSYGERSVRIEHGPQGIAKSSSANEYKTDENGQLYVQYPKDVVDDEWHEVYDARGKKVKLAAKGKDDVKDPADFVTDGPNPRAIHVDGSHASDTHITYREAGRDARVLKPEDMYGSRLADPSERFAHHEYGDFALGAAAGERPLQERIDEYQNEVVAKDGAGEDVTRAQASESDARSRPTKRWVRKGKMPPKDGKDHRPTDYSAMVNRIPSARAGSTRPAAEPVPGADEQIRTASVDYDYESKSQGGTLGQKTGWNPNSFDSVQLPPIPGETVPDANGTGAGGQATPGPKGKARQNRKGQARSNRRGSDTGGQAQPDRRSQAQPGARGGSGQAQPGRRRGTGTGGRTTPGARGQAAPDRRGEASPGATGDGADPDMGQSGNDRQGREAHR